MKELFKFGGTVDKKTATVTGIAGAVILILIWHLVTSLGVISAKILPNPIDMLKSIPYLISEKDLFGNIIYTIGLNWLGYVYALVIAIPLGFLIGIYPVLSSMFQKPLDALRFTPVPVLTGIFVAAIGLGFDMKSSFLAFAILIYIMPTVVQRVSELQNPNSKDNIYIQTGKTLGMSNFQMFRYVYFPHVMEKVYVDVRNLCAVSFSYCTIAENINREGGLGACINIMTRQSDMASVYAMLFMIIIIGVLQDQLFRIFEPVIFKHKRA